MRVSEGPTHALRMTTRSGKDYKPRDVMSEGEASERSEGGTEMSETTTALLQLLREQQRALTEQQQQAREQQMQAQEQQAAQQALLLRVVEQQKEEMARYREEMSHLLRKEESPAKSKLPKPTLQKLGPNDDIEHFLATFERIAKQQEWPDTVWATQLAGLLTGKALAGICSYDERGSAGLRESERGSPAPVRRQRRDAPAAISAG